MRQGHKFWACAALIAGCGGGDGGTGQGGVFEVNGYHAMALPDGGTTLMADGEHGDAGYVSRTGDGSGTGAGAGTGTGVGTGAGTGSETGTGTGTGTGAGTGAAGTGTGEMTGNPPPVSGAGPDPSKLPKPKGTCPKLADGSLSIAGATVKMWVGSKPGPVIFYFHGTGSTPDEVNAGVPNATTNVKTNGGIVASWDKSNGMGTSTGGPWAVWYTGDYDAADEILACGIEQGLVDTSHIHVAGYSAGGLQTGAMIFDRSNYIASAVVYSGGRVLGGQSLQDPSNVPSVVFAHGAPGSDQLIVDFANLSTQLEGVLRQDGGFVIDCNDGGSHVDLSRLGVKGKATEFFQNHPYGSAPDSSLSGWPSFCSIVK